MVTCPDCGGSYPAGTPHHCIDDIEERFHPHFPHLTKRVLRGIIVLWMPTGQSEDALVDILQDESEKMAGMVGASLRNTDTPVGTGHLVGRSTAGRGSGAAPPPTQQKHDPADPAASAATDNGRVVGVLGFWKADQRNQLYGFVKLESGENVFVHSNAIVHGVPHAGAQLSFRVEPSPKDASKRQAYDAVVLQAGETLGVIVRWPLRDKNKALYGFVRPTGSATDDAVYFSGCHFAEAAFNVGCEAVFALQASPTRPGTEQAVSLRLIVGRGDGTEQQRQQQDQRHAIQQPSSAAAACPQPPPPPPPPSLVRHTGILQSWRFDQHQQYYGFAALPDGESLFVHANAVVAGGPPAVGATVSFRIAENPRHTSQKQARDVVVLQRGERVGCVVRWPLRDKRRKLFGFVSTGDGGASSSSHENAYFAPTHDAQMHEDAFRVGCEVVFALRESPAKPGTMQAYDVRPITGVLGTKGATTPWATSTGALSPVHLLWDFDEVNQWTPQQITATYLSILDRLVLMGHAMRHSDVASVAVSSQPLTAAAQRTLLDLRVKPQQVVVGENRKLATYEAVESVAQAVLDTPTNNTGDDQQRTIVLVSSDVHFRSMVRGLEDNGVRVIWIHNAEPGSEDEAKIESSGPTMALHISDFELTTSLILVAPVSPPAPPPAVSVRLTGKLTGWGWKTDAEGELYGYAEIDAGAGHHKDSALVRHATIIYGTPRAGARLSFRVEPHVLQATKLQAYDVVVLRGAEEVGQVLRWPLWDKKAQLYGFVCSPGAPGGAYFAGGAYCVSDVAVGCDVVVTLEANPKAAPGTKQAVGLSVLRTRAYPFDDAAAPFAAPPPPPPPRNSHPPTASPIMSTVVRPQPPPPPPRNSHPPTASPIMSTVVVRPPPPPPPSLHSHPPTASPIMSTVVERPPVVQPKQTINLSMFGLPDGAAPTPDALLRAESTPGKGRLIAWVPENNLGLIAADRREFGDVLLLESAIECGEPRVGDMVTFKMRISTIRTGGAEQKQIVANGAMIFND